MDRIGSSRVWNVRYIHKRTHTLARNSGYAQNSAKAFAACASVRNGGEIRLGDDAHFLARNLNLMRSINKELGGPVNRILLLGREVLCTFNAILEALTLHDQATKAVAPAIGRWWWLNAFSAVLFDLRLQVRVL
jgi:hypothetical protein